MVQMPHVLLAQLCGSLWAETNTPTPTGHPGREILTQPLSDKLSALLGSRENFLDALPCCQGLQETSWGWGGWAWHSTGLSCLGTLYLCSVLQQVVPPQHWCRLGALCSGVSTLIWGFLAFPPLLEDLAQSK